MLAREELKKYIIEHGMKQKYIAKQVGISEKAFSCILAGKRKCNVSEYMNICICLKVSTSKFIY